MAATPAANRRTASGHAPSGICIPKRMSVTPCDLPFGIYKRLLLCILLCVHHNDERGNTMARRTVYVPDELSERMNQISDAVNWSQVACRAFEMKLGELAAQKEVKQTQDVIQRLRASRIEAEQNEEGMYQQGHQLGRQWAGDTATWSQLKRLPCGRQGTGFALLTEGVVPEDDDAASDYLAHKILGDNWNPAEFWTTVCGNGYDSRLESGGFVKGFADGARELRDEVSQQVEGGALPYEPGGTEARANSG
jgi:hypothetical protein